MRNQMLLINNAINPTFNQINSCFLSSPGYGLDCGWVKEIKEAEKSKKLSFYEELELKAFPNNPIREWAEKEAKRIDEWYKSKYGWLDGIKVKPIEPIVFDTYKRKSIFKRIGGKLFGT